VKLLEAAKTDIFQLLWQTLR